ncbi:MAG: hypothetical protein ACOY7T_05910 [Pseudomonadota bacterium]
MAQSMHLIVLKETGHVLGALSGAAFAADPTLEDLCGEAFPVSGVRRAASPGNPGVVLVPREQLALKSVTLDPAVLAACRDYIIDGTHLTRIVPPGGVPAVSLDQDKVNLAGLGEKTLVAIGGADDPEADRRIGIASSIPFSPIMLGTIPDGAVAMPVVAGAQCMVMVATLGKPIRVVRETA